MTYGRDDDRYYRAELQSIDDALGDLHERLAAIADELRGDEPQDTLAARHKIALTRQQIAGARLNVRTATRTLPVPATGTSLWAVKR